MAEIIDEKGNRIDREYINNLLMSVQTVKVWGRELWDNVGKASYFDDFLFVTLYDQFNRPIVRVDNQRDDAVIVNFGKIRSPLNG